MLKARPVTSASARLDVDGARCDRAVRSRSAQKAPGIDFSEIFLVYAMATQSHIHSPSTPNPIVDLDQVSALVDRADRDSYFARRRPRCRKRVRRSPRTSLDFERSRAKGFASDELEVFACRFLPATVHSPLTKAQLREKVRHWRSHNSPKSPPRKAFRPTGLGGFRPSLSPGDGTFAINEGTIDSESWRSAAEWQAPPCRRHNR